MGGKSGISIPKVKIAAPKITVGKDLGMKNIGKAASNVVKATGKAGEDIGRGVGKGATAAYQTAGKYGSALTKTLGKGAEGLVANAADLGENLAQGDFKGMGSEALQLLQSGKDIAKGLTKAQAGLGTGLLGSVGSSLSDKNITGAAKNIETETGKGVDKYGDAAIDAAANAATVGAYGAGKTALQGLSSGGLGGLVSGKGLQDAALGLAGSYAGVDPNMLKMGMSAASGDLKGAALQGLGSFAGLSPDQMKMATTGAAALTGDKKGLASGLASQFGAGDSVANMVGAAAGGKKNDMINALGGQLGLDPKIASTLGAVASGDLKGAALGKIAESTGLSPDILKQVSTGKFDVGELAKNANLTASLGGMAQSYLPGSVSNMVGNAGRIVESADAYKDDIQNQALDRAGLSRDQVQGIQDVQNAAQSAYKIAKGDTLAAIAKRQGLTVEALMAANPNIKDPNKIAAGMNLNIPKAAPAGRQPETPEQTAARRAEADRKALEAAGGVPQEKGFLDKAGEFLGGIGDKIGGAVDAAGNFIKENPMLATGAIQAGAATAGYMAGDKARDEQEKLLEKQILETQGVAALKNYQLSKERDTAYGEQQKFLQERIAGGGMTAKEKEMQQQGQMKAAKMAAAGRLAGVEQQARMGQGVTGAGSSLAASLAGAQAQSNAAAESERAVATSAAENVEKAFAARPAALEAKAQAEMNLATLKDTTELNKLKQIGESRTAQGTMAAQEGEAQGRLASGLADIATRGVLGQQIGPSDATAKEREIAAQAEVDRKKKEADDKAKADAALAAKANAAGNVSGSAPTQSNAQNAGRAPATQAPPQTQADKFNQAGKAPAPAPQPGQGQGYGVLAPVQNIISNPSQAIKNPGQAVQAVQQVVKNPQVAIDEAKKKAEEAAKKAVGGLVPDSMKNIFGMK